MKCPQNLQDIYKIILREFRVFFRADPSQIGRQQQIPPPFAAAKEHAAALREETSASEKVPVLGARWDDSLTLGKS